MQLNWLPEPEFGGFFEAKRMGGLKDVELLPGSPGVPTASLIASGKVDYGVVSADEIVRLVAQSAPIVAVFASFNTSPRGVVVHADSPYQSLEELWKSESTVGMEPGQGYVRWLDKKYGGTMLHRVPRPASLATFMQDKTFAQGIYVFAEGAELARRGVKTRIFEVAQSGYNPYEVVLATQPERIQRDPAQVGRIVADLRAGWEAYLKSPAPANAMMAKKNPAMPLEAMQSSTQLLTPLVRNPGQPLGSMQRQRWETLIEQMRSIGALKNPVDPSRCFWNPPST